MQKIDTSTKIKYLAVFLAAAELFILDSQIVEMAFSKFKFFEFTKKEKFDRKSY